MTGGKRHDIYVEQLWKGVARSTLLEPQLHISNLKHTARHHDRHIYPAWWGHEEYHQEGYSLAILKRKSESKRLAADEKVVPVSDSFPAAGLKTKMESTTVFPPVCDHWPKKMVDENTQTDDALLPLDFHPIEHRKPPLASKIPILASYSGFMGGAIAATSSDHATATSISKVAPKSSSRVVKKFVPRVSVANSKKAAPVLTEYVPPYTTSSIQTELSSRRPEENLSYLASSLKEAVEMPLETKTFPSTPSAKLEQENQKLASPTKSISSPFPEKIPPPLDGVYALATNFLNGPIVQLLDIDHGNTTFTIAESLLLDSKSFWLDDATAGISQTS